MISISDILQQQYNSIQVELIRCRSNPYDAVRIHDLRVAIRTLRGLIKFLKKKLPQTACEDIDKNLSKAAKILGPLRELDVLIAKSGEFAYNHPEENTNYRQIFKNFHIKRDEELQKFLVSSIQQSLITYLIHVKTQLDALDFNKKIDWSKYLSRELDRRKVKLMRLYADLDFKNYTLVHQIRKKAKTLRYSTTYFAKFLSKNDKKVSKKARKIQSICGKITDAHVNYDLLHHLAEQAENKHAKETLLRIAQAQRKIYISEETN
ncbi:CHAD domain-containing protein [Liquorilactobacillus uvarum]|uniref:CHAD domain protein n=1 Tax=Liquorilactobacillus uvarum DSM 19971 TaxID=1423812 RepID=A0A0R1PQI4_9LACO|nr:CHAD domain-containing protein [Liquorilactobacillus uvarum]KRL34701.1 CHAD domain protein [Liquorilactobacillus uvarum DSM 19971]